METGAVKSGESVAKAQIGPNAQALLISLRFDYRMPMRGISAVLAEWFGLQLSPGGVSPLLDRKREWSAASYTEIQSRVRQSPVVGMDETGLRQDGATGWAWLARTPEASLFRVEPSRASWVAADNNGSERDIRCLAVFRKVTGGTRSTNGNRTLGHWMSVTQTLRKNGLPLKDYVVGLNTSHLLGYPPPSVFSPN